MSVRIGVIGTGNMGADHIRNLQRFVAGPQVTVVADYDRATAEAVAAGPAPGSPPTVTP